MYLDFTVVTGDTVMMMDRNGTSDWLTETEREETQKNITNFLQFTELKLIVQRNYRWSTS